MFFKLTGGHVVAVAVDPDGVVKSLDVFEYESVGMLYVKDPESVQPLPFDNGVERFDTGVVVGITLVAVAELELFCSLTVSIGDILAAPVGVEDEGQIGIAPGFCLVDGIDHKGSPQGFRQGPGDDLAGIQVHNTGEVNEAAPGPYVGDIGTPDSIRTVGVKLLTQDVVELIAEVGIHSGGDPGLDPLGAEAHLPHIFADSAFGDGLTIFTEHRCDLWSTVVLLGAIVDLSDLFLNSSLMLLGGRRFVLKESPITGS